MERHTINASVEEGVHPLACRRFAYYGLRQCSGQNCKMSVAVRLRPISVLTMMGALRKCQLVEPFAHIAQHLLPQLSWWLLKQDFLLPESLRELAAE
jgi:hypothetical protein